MSRSAYIASRLVAGKPVFREARDGTLIGTAQPPLNLGDDELRANNVGDQDGWHNQKRPSVGDRVRLIKARMAQILNGSVKPAEELPAPVGDNRPPPTAGQDAFPALQMPPDLR